MKDAQRARACIYKSVSRMPRRHKYKVGASLDEGAEAVVLRINDYWREPNPSQKRELDGLSDSAWRERIGNMVPPDAAEAIGGVIGTTLLLAWSGESFALGSTPIWVRDVAVALSVAQRVPS